MPRRGRCTTTEKPVKGTYVKWNGQGVADLDGACEQEDLEGGQKRDDNRHQPGPPPYGASPEESR